MYLTVELLSAVFRRKVLLNAWLTYCEPFLYVFAATVLSAQLSSVYMLCMHECCIVSSLVYIGKVGNILVSSDVDFDLEMIYVAKNHHLYIANYEVIFVTDGSACLCMSTPGNINQTCCYRQNCGLWLTAMNTDCGLCTITCSLRFPIKLILKDWS